jgi:hypothetical protein
MGTTFLDWEPIWRCDVAATDPALLVEVTRAAQGLLWALTGRRFGQAQTVGERYRAVASSTGECGGPYKTSDGEWHNASRGRDCCALHVYHQPVRQIDEVRLDGVVLAASGYDLEGATLRRVGTCWPIVDDCEAAVIEVDYTWGADVPVAGRLALGEVACDLLSGWTGGECRLPSRVVSITRQGVTVDLADPQLFITSGLLGLPIADAWIRSVNPNGLKERSRVFSPDMGRRTG